MSLWSVVHNCKCISRAFFLWSIRRLDCTDRTILYLRCKEPLRVDRTSGWIQDDSLCAYLEHLQDAVLPKGSFVSLSWFNERLDNIQYRVTRAWRSKQAWEIAGGVVLVDGGHWVAIVIDKVSATVEYYDSFGQPPPSSIISTLSMTSKLVGSEESRLDFLFNRVRHQRDYYQCGVYALRFIQLRVLGYTFENVVSTGVSKSALNDFRATCFAGQVYI